MQGQPRSKVVQHDVFRTFVVYTEEVGSQGKRPNPALSFFSLIVVGIIEYLAPTEKYQRKGNNRTLDFASLSVSIQPFWSSLSNCFKQDITF